MKLKSIALAFLFFSAASEAGATSTAFDVLDDHLSVAHFSGIGVTAYSVGCWIKRLGNGEGGNNTRVFDKFSTPNGWMVRDREAAGTYMFSAGFSTNDGSWTITRPADNQWHHIAFAYTHTLTTNDPVAWIDGAPVTVSNPDNPAGTASTGGFVFRIGNTADQSNTFNGSIGACFYYDRILTTSEIAQVMRFGPQTLTNGLVCNWPMGLWNAASVGGSGGSSCNGTESGSPADDESGPPISIGQGGWLWQ